MTGPKKMLSTKRQHDGDVSTGKARIASTAGSISKKNKTNNKFDDDINNNCNDNNDETIEFASHIIVQFLSTPSLTSFSSCSKACMATVKTEVSNRKKKIAQMNSRVKELLGLTAVSHDDNKDDGDDEFATRWRKCFVPTRANVMEAELLCKEATRIIDTDLDWQDRINSEDWMNDDFNPPMDKYFEKERELLGSERDLRMLPICFYLSTDGSEPLQQLEEKHMKSALSSVGRIWGAEDLVGSVHEIYSDDPLYYSDPFFKFNVSLAQNFAEIVCDHAYEFASSSSGLAALRFAAREQVYCRPHSRDCTHYLIHCADNYRQEILEENNNN